MNGAPTDAGLEIPEGRLVRSRVGVASALKAALSRDLTGYARIEPDSLLADGEPSVLTFADGVPRAAYCGRGGSHENQRGDSRGVDALAALAGPGPCSVELYELPPGALSAVHDTPAFSVPPGAPAEELADDPARVLGNARPTTPAPTAPTPARWSRSSRTRSASPRSRRRLARRRSGGPRSGGSTRSWSSYVAPSGVVSRSSRTYRGVETAVDSMRLSVGN